MVLYRVTLASRCAWVSSEAKAPAAKRELRQLAVDAGEKDPGVRAAVVEPVEIATGKAGVLAALNAHATVAA